MVACMGIFTWILNRQECVFIWIGHFNIMLVDERWAKTDIDRLGDEHLACIESAKQATWLNSYYCTMISFKYKIEVYLYFPSVIAIIMLWLSGFVKFIFRIITFALKHYLVYIACNHFHYGKFLWVDMYMVKQL